MNVKQCSSPCHISTATTPTRIILKNKIDPILVALAALYLAAKVHERKKTVFLKDFIYMSGKQYVTNDIEVMEIKLLYVLSWYKTSSIRIYWEQ